MNLARVFVEALGAGDPEPALESALSAACAAAEGDHPSLAVTRDAFVRHLARHATDGAAPLGRAADLYLTLACALGDARALAVLDPLIVTSVARAVARMDGGPTFRDLVAQELRARLLLGDAPRVAEYAGRAPLDRWLKTVAVRVALNLRRGEKERARAELPSGLVGEGEPEGDLLRARHRGAFADSVRDAFAALPARDRELLRLNLREGESIDALAARYGVGRSTAARWLAAAREALATETKRHVQRRLGVGASELESLARAVRSHIDVSLGRLFDEG